MKSWISLLLLCASLAASGADKVVRIYNWSDYISPEAIAGFTAKTGIKVIYDVYDSNETLEAKLLVGRSGYDLVFAAARPYAARQIQAKLLRALEPAKLPNLKHLDQGLLKSLNDIDPNSRFALPYMWGTTGLGINVDQVKKALGSGVTLDSWQLLLNPANVSKLKSCGVSILDDETEGLGAVLVALGRPPQSAVPADLALAAKTISAIRPSLRYFHSSRYITDLASGDLCLAMGYSGDVVQAKNRAIEAGNGVNIRYIIPKEGAVRWMDLMMIPKDAPDADAAHAFINYLMEPAVIAQISDFVGYANANASATSLVSDAVRFDPGIYPPALVTAKLVPNAQISDINKRKRSRAWVNMKAGRGQ